MAIPLLDSDNLAITNRCVAASLPATHAIPRPSELAERSLRFHQELNTCRLQRSNGVTCWLDHAGRAVDPEGVHGVAILVLSEEQLTERIDPEIARCLTQRIKVIDPLDSTSALVNGKNRDRVMASVATVDKST